MATKQSLLLLLALLAAAAAVASAVTDVEYCNKGKKYPVKVSGVEIVPDPVARGEPATCRRRPTSPPPCGGRKTRR